MTSKKKSGDISWTVEEFSKVDLQDKRLNKRCQKIVSDLEQQPTDPINQACEDWTDTKAAYRFLAIPQYRLKGLLIRIVNAPSSA